MQDMATQGPMAYVPIRMYRGTFTSAKELCRKNKRPASIVNNGLFGAACKAGDLS